MADFCACFKLFLPEIPRLTMNEDEVRKIVRFKDGRAPAPISSFENGTTISDRGHGVPFSLSKDYPSMSSSLTAGAKWNEVICLNTIDIRKKRTRTNTFLKKEAMMQKHGLGSMKAHSHERRDSASYIETEPTIRPMPVVDCSAVGFPYADEEHKPEHMNTAAGGPFDDPSFSSGDVSINHYGLCGESTNRPHAVETITWTKAADDSGEAREGQQTTGNRSVLNNVRRQEGKGKENRFDIDGDNEGAVVGNQEQEGDLGLVENSADSVSRETASDVWAVEGFLRSLPQKIPSGESVYGISVLLVVLCMSTITLALWTFFAFPLASVNAGLESNQTFLWIHLTWQELFLHIAIAHVFDKCFDRARLPFAPWSLYVKAIIAGIVVQKAFDVALAYYVFPVPIWLSVTSVAGLLVNAAFLVYLIGRKWTEGHGAFQSKARYCLMMLVWYGVAYVTATFWAVLYYHWTNPALRSLSGVILALVRILVKNILAATTAIEANDHQKEILLQPIDLIYNRVQIDVMPFSGDWVSAVLTLAAESASLLLLRRYGLGDRVSVIWSLVWNRLFCCNKDKAKELQELYEVDTTGEMTRQILLSDPSNFHIVNQKRVDDEQTKGEVKKRMKLLQKNGGRAFQPGISTRLQGRPVDFVVPTETPRESSLDRKPIVFHTMQRGSSMDVEKANSDQGAISLDITSTQHGPYDDLEDSDDDSSRSNDDTTSVLEPTDHTSFESNEDDIDWMQRYLFHIVDSCSAAVALILMNVQQLINFALSQSFPRFGGHLNASFVLPDGQYVEALKFNLPSLASSILILCVVNVAIARDTRNGRREFWLTDVLRYSFRDSFYFWATSLLVTTTFTTSTMINHFGVDTSLEINWLRCDEGEMVLWPDCAPIAANATLDLFS